MEACAPESRKPDSGSCLLHFNQNSTLNQLLKVIGDGKHRSLLSDQDAQLHIPVESVLGQIRAADKRYVIHDGALDV